MKMNQKESEIWRVRQCERGDNLSSILQRTAFLSNCLGFILLSSVIINNLSLHFLSLVKSISPFSSTSRHLSGSIPNT